MISRTGSGSLVMTSYTSRSLPTFPMALLNTDWGLPYGLAMVQRRWITWTMGKGGQKKKKKRWSPWFLLLSNLGPRSYAFLVPCSSHNEKHILRWSLYITKVSCRNGSISTTERCHTQSNGTDLWLAVVANRHLKWQLFLKERDKG